MHVVKMNGYHNIDMKQLYAQVHESEDWQNFELTDDEKEMQKRLNSESVMTDEMEELVNQYFLDAETSRKKFNKKYYNCVEILSIVGYKDSNFRNSTNRLAKLLIKLGYKRRLNDKKFLRRLNDKKFLIAQKRRFNNLPLNLVCIFSRSSARTYYPWP